MINSNIINYLVIFLFFGLWSSIGSDPYNFLFIDDSLQFIELCNRYNYPSIHYKKNKNLKHEIYTYNSTLCR